MSLFDDTVKTPIYPFPSGVEPYNHRYSSVVLSQIEKNGIALSNDEEEALASFYEQPLLGKGLFHLIHLLNDRNGVIVSLSGKEEFVIGDTEYPINPFKINDNRIVLLGKYMPLEDRIVLFIKTIRAAADVFEYGDGENKYKMLSGDILLYTLAHELYHASFHKCKNYIMEYEEPLAEFGALVYMNCYYHVTNKDNTAMWGLHSLVQSKTQEGIECYSKGGELFSKLQTNLSLIHLLDFYENHDVSKPSIQKRLEDIIYGIYTALP